MWTLMKKNAFLFVLLSVSLMALLTVYLLMVRKTLSINILIFLGQMLMYCILASVLTSEKTEEKNNGYAFMSHLPIRDRDIVGSKFAVVLVATVLLCVYSAGLLSFMKPDAGLLSFGRIYILLCGNLGLIIAAGMYLLIYRWGYSIFMKISAFIVVLLMVGPFLVMEFVLVRRNIDYGASLQSLKDLPWLIWMFVTVLTLVLFWGLLQAALFAKKYQRA
ncbi:MAG: ABC-2 transporter permease [Candidatus Aminicenantes bacterium]|jgi:hypothetical protein